MSTPFTSKVKKLIKKIPEGKVATYGFIAALAGNPQAARQVARILHSCSRKDSLPWHRVVNRNGRISLKHYNGYEVQKQLLEKEGVVFAENDAIDFDTYLWLPPNVSRRIHGTNETVGI
ncbi:MAG TPA: MGMT family protein [Deltaproteobacteria bacterium]|nr:MGMT family protein [Deltaproteobacteria bacterium]